MVPRRTPPGRERRVTAAWEAELLRVIELDPHAVGQKQPNWTTELLAEYLGKQTGIQVTEETVRVYLHAHGYVCKRPTWTLATQSGRASRLCGKRLRVEVVLAGATAPEPLPVEIWLKLICGVNVPADVPHLLALLPRADLYLQDEVQFAFHPTLTRVWSLKGRRGQRLVEAPGDNRHASMALGWWTGETGGLMAGLRLYELLMSFVEQVRAAVARSQRSGGVWR